MHVFGGTAHVPLTQACTRPWSNQNCSLNEAIPLVKIHGNYCGPNWTAGQRKPASLIDALPYVAPTDALDAACLEHDRSCKNGCSSKGDLKLRNAALMVAVQNPKLRPVALAIAASMQVASRGRSQ